MPDIEFINSPKSEMERIEFTRKIIASGFYQKHGFVVLPELNDGVNPNVSVILPRTFEYEPIYLEKFEDEWKQANLAFWQEIEVYFPGVAKKHGKLVVNLTRYGTVCSGEKMSEYNAEKVGYFLRNDTDISQLAAVILNKIMYFQRKDLGVSWSKREALMDFIMTRPGMRKLFPSFHPVFAQLSMVPTKWRKFSENYVRELGIEMVTPEWEVKHGKIWLKAKLLGKELTKQEKEVVKTLVNNLGELVTYDELADVLWGEGEFKSFWAINKTLERLRGKLTKLGLEGERLESIRGQGYLLR